MSDPLFPGFVERFIGLTGEFLGEFNLRLCLRDANDASYSKTYEVFVEDGVVTVVVHRTAASLDDEIGDYRVRVIAPMPLKYIDLIKGKENLANRFATLGCIVEGDSAITAQCLVPSKFQETTAGILAASIAQARKSLMVSYMKVLSNAEDGTVKHLSAWSDLDFEGLHYDYAHLGTGSINQRGWTFRFFRGAELTIDAVHNNPYWGGGVLCLLKVAKTDVGDSDVKTSAADLNIWANLVGQAPTFGAWCEERETYIFVQFLPNFMKTLSDVLEMVVFHATLRHAEVPILAAAEKRYRAE